MRLLARLYYKRADDPDDGFEPDVEWRETDDGKILIGEVCYGWEFGEGTVETLPKKELVINLSLYAISDNTKLKVYDEDLAKKLNRIGVPFERGDGDA